MNQHLIDRLKSTSLITRILQVISISFLSFLFISGHEVYLEYSNYSKSLDMRHNSKVIEVASKLIREVQIERGRSAVFLKSEASQVQGKLVDQRSIVDKNLLNLQNSLTGFFDVNLADKILKEFNELKSLRSRVNKKQPQNVIIDYTRLISHLIDLQIACKYNSTLKVAGEVKSITMLEQARENAGLLRANLSGVVAKDMPLEEETFQKILQLKSGIDANLSSKAHELSESSAALVKSFYQTDHWSETNNIFKSILTLSNEGGYGEDSQEVFATTTKVVDDIGNIIKNEIIFLKKNIENAYQESVQALQAIILMIAINLGFIITLTWFAVKKIKEQMSDIIHEVQDSTNNVHQASNQLSQTSHNLSASSQETSSALQETVSSMSEMSSMVSRTRDKSAETKDASEHIKDRVDSAQVTVTDMVKSMEALSQAKTKLAEVNQVIRSISKQTQVINDIVFKTQLLAVNASIEAAKAGSHGKGFAVVADEVSKLAQLSGESSQRISSLLDESEQKVNQITSDVNDRVSRGADTAQSVQSVFNNISKDVQQIKVLSDDMAQACEEQSLGIEQMTMAIAQIDESTQANTSEAQVVEQHSTYLKANAHSLQNISMDLMTRILGGSSQTIPNQSKSQDTDHSHTSEIQKPISDSQDIPLQNDFHDDDIADHDSFRPAS